MNIPIKFCSEAYFFSSVIFTYELNFAILSSGFHYVFNTIALTVKILIYLFTIDITLLNFFHQIILAVFSHNGPLTQFGSS